MNYDHFYEVLIPKGNKQENDLQENIKRVLEVGCRDRFKEIEAFYLGYKKESGLKIFLIAIRLDENWDDVLTRGPSADSQEAKEFRNFYGELSQIRKFPDGSLCEAVLWTEGKARDPKVLVKIAKNIISK